jgi:hypothetical protein
MIDNQPYPLKICGLTKSEYRIIDRLLKAYSGRTRGIRTG